ncbi:TetR/AcrR family transcriptional regulator [Mycolicibacterium moriokaense]|nr:TetR/AcrR family transcriptional regulator [Mycolicibacterium moriokaense]
MGDVVYLRRDDADARKVLDATIELLREVPYTTLTMRAIGSRAGISSGELRALFRSKDAIVAEIYLERLRAIPLEIDVEHTVQERVCTQFESLMMVLAGEPGLAAACSSALVSDEPSVRSVQRRIHDELRRRVRSAMRSGAWPEVTETLEFGLIGSLVHASCGDVTSRQTADHLASVVSALLPDD